MAGGPKQVGTQTVKTENDPWNADYLTRLYDNAENLYGQGNTNYTDPSLSKTYNDYLGVGDTLSKTTAPAAYGAWDNAITGGLGGSNSPVYWDQYNLGKGQTQQQLNMAGYSTGLSGIAKDAPTTAAGYANDLSDIAGQAATAGQTYADQTTGYGTGALAAGNRYGDTLSQTGAAAIASGNRYGDYLTGLADRTQGSTNPYQSTLLDTAQGRYLNANPYLDDTYNSAADAVTRRYQTAVAPQTDSRFERASGRYGSGALANERSQNRQDLGGALDSLASDIYGKNYAAERGYQNTAAQAGGNLSLAETDAARQAYTAAANAAQAGYGSGLTGYSDASKSSLAGYNAAQTGATEAGKLALSGLEGARLGYGNAASAADTGYNTAANAYRGAGAIDASNLTSQASGLNALQSGYEKGNLNTLSALGQTGTVNTALTAPYSTALTGAKGLQDIGQTAADADWGNLTNLSGILGKAIQGDSSTATPIYGKSNLQQGLDIAKTGASLAAGLK